MKTPACTARSLAALFLAMTFGAAISAQLAPAQKRLPGDMAGDAPPPDPKGTDPKPADATAAILTAFENYEVVGISAAHGNKDLDDFVLHVVRNSAFATKVNDIVVECGNSLYQQTLDRYIAGDDVPLAEVRKVWRNTTQPMCGVSAFYEELFPLVRRINQSLAPGKKLRVLAGDPPIDWSKVKTGRDFAQGQFLMVRDANIASVMEKEVLAKHRKALMLFGTAHLFHAESTAVGIYEKKYPGVTLVIADHSGFGNWTPLAKYNNEFEARMASWTVPSLVLQMKGTWLLDLLDTTYSSGNVMFDGTDGGKLPSAPAKAKGTFAEVPPEALLKFSEKVDAYLYLGPRDLLLNEPTPAAVFLDKDYVTELQRRAAIMGGGPITDEANPKKVSERDSNTFFYDPGELDKMMQSPRGDSPISGRDN
jgi:hypothetical protein